MSGVTEDGLPAWAKEMWEEFDRLHTISPTAINPTVRTHNGGSRVTHQRREKIADEDMEYMIDKCLLRESLVTPLFRQLL